MSDAGNTIVRVTDVHKRYGSLRVLKGLNLQVNRGEVYGFLGRNGAGKSTAIRILMGITRFDKGAIDLFGQPLRSHLTGARQRIGYVAQEQNFYAWMTPVRLAGFVSGFYPRWQQSRYDGLLNDFDLPPKRKIGTFSGGMKAKLGLSLALATRPELLILDEPTAGMDPVGRREFLDLVREQAMHDGTAILFSTHLIDDIEAAADRIAIVEAGKTAYEGALAPLTRSIAAFSAAQPVASVADEVIALPAGESPSELSGESTDQMPGEFAGTGACLLMRTERAGRRFVVMRFDGDAPTHPALNPGWRKEPMSLEDVFIAMVHAR